jgi:hypothetical protein
MQNPNFVIADIWNQNTEELVVYLLSYEAK